MYTKVLIAATAVVAQAAAFSMPSCWSDCFAKYEIQSEQCLCSDPLEEVVSCCIDLGCQASNMTSAATQYASWVSNYCDSNAQPPPPVTVTSETSVYTTICPVTESSTTHLTTSTLTEYHPITHTAWSYITKTTTSTGVTTCETGPSTYTSTYVTTKTPGYNSWATKSVAPVTSWGQGPVIPTYAAPSSSAYPTWYTTAKANATAPWSPGSTWANAASPAVVGGGLGLSGLFAVVAFFL